MVRVSTVPPEIHANGPLPPLAFRSHNYNGSDQIPPQVLAGIASIVTTPVTPIQRVVAVGKTVRIAVTRSLAVVRVPAIARVLAANQGAAGTVETWI
jgi:hypothetical protein